MIVKCEQCQTRFKIPDDKVTDKGVKVRCTKCGHTFRVTRDMAQPAAAPAATAGAPPLANDPFAKFGAPAAPPMGEVTRPGVFALGVEATRAPERAPSPASFDFASLAPPLTTAPTMPAVPAYAPSAPTVPAVPAYVPQSPASNPFDFASVSPPASAAPAPAAFDFSGFAAPTQPMAPLPAARPPPPPSAPPPAYDFSRGASAAPPAAPAPAYGGYGSNVPPAAAPAAFDFASVAPPAQAAPAAFDFASVAPPAQAAAPAAFDFSSVAPPAQAAAPAAFDFASVAPPAAAGAPPPAFDFAAVAPPTSGLGDSSTPFDFGAAAGGQGADNFFSAAPAADLGGPSAGDARAMFDLPPPPAAVPAPSLLDLPPVEPDAAPAARPPERAPAPSAPAAAPAAEAPEKGRRRNVVGIVVNVVIAALLVVGLMVVGSAYLNEGKFSADALSLENLKNTFAPSVDFVANDVSNGLYETRQGRAVFFVRGEVLNRSDATVKVVVKAEIVEGGKVVRFGESFAGEPATPEELYLIDGAEALEVLQRKVEKRALVVPPGAAAAFVVPFTEYPPDLKDFRVRVSARAVPAEPTAATP